MADSGFKVRGPSSNNTHILSKESLIYFMPRFAGAQGASANTSPIFVIDVTGL